MAGAARTLSVGRPYPESTLFMMVVASSLPMAICTSSGAAAARSSSRRRPPPGAEAAPPGPAAPRGPLAPRPLVLAAPWAGPQLLGPSAGWVSWSGCPAGAARAAVARLADGRGAAPRACVRAIGARPLLGALDMKGPCAWLESCIVVSIGRSDTNVLLHCSCRRDAPRSRGLTTRRKNDVVYVIMMHSSA